MSGPVEDVVGRLVQPRAVLIVPGFGVAAAAAGPHLAVLAEVLTRSGAEVLFGIHPIAGRFPGHLNHTLALAGVSDDRQVRATSVELTGRLVLAVGAYDVVNPALGGLELTGADAVMIINASDDRGYSKIANPTILGLPTTYGPLPVSLLTLADRIGRSWSDRSPEAGSGQPQGAQP